MATRRWPPGGRAASATLLPGPGRAQDLFDIARRTAEEHGRDPDAIELTAAIPDDLDDIPKLAAMGITRLAVPVSPIAGLATVIQSPDDCAAWTETIERYAEVSSRRGGR